MYRLLVRDAGGETEHHCLRDNLPPWVLDIIVEKNMPKFTKIPFYILPHKSTNIKCTKSDRLVANDFLQIHKVKKFLEHFFFFNNGGKKRKSNLNIQITSLSYNLLINILFHITLIDDIPTLKQSFVRTTLICKSAIMDYGSYSSIWNPAISYVCLHLPLFRNVRNVSTWKKTKIMCCSILLGSGACTGEDFRLGGRWIDFRTRQLTQ